MMVYLVRHGKAEPGTIDSERRLTAGGRKSVSRIARRLAAADVRVERIEHSGLVRARETAEIMAEALGARMDAAPGLAPEDDVAPIAQRLENASSDTLMLVGHNPFMQDLATYLLTGNEIGEFIHVRTSTALCLSNDGGPWALEWMITPDIA